VYPDSKNGGWYLQFRENHPGNTNFLQKTFAKTKIFAKKKIFAKQNFAKSEQIFAYFRISWKWKKGFFVSTLPTNPLLPRKRARA
jgi:hypothetical protein